MLFVPAFPHIFPQYSLSPVYLIEIPTILIEEPALLLPTTSPIDWLLAAVDLSVTPPSKCLITLSSSKMLYPLILTLLLFVSDGLHSVAVLFTFVLAVVGWLPPVRAPAIPPVPL